MTDLQNSDGRYRDLAETLPQLVWTTGPDGYHDYFNRRWYEFTGLRPEQSIGDGWSTAVHPEEIPLAQERWRHALSTGKLYEVEYRIRGADGRYRWFLGRALPIRDASGRILRWFGTCTDIEAQKEAEEALRRLDEQHRLALEAAELGTWDYGVASGVIRCDERTCALFGIATDKLRSLPFNDTLTQIHEEDRQRVEEQLGAALDPRSDGRYDVEYRIRLTDGGTRWLHARGQTFYAGEGAARRAVRLSGVISDVTQRRTAEEAQELLTRELNHRVKNLFAIISGIVSMTARAAKTPKEMATALRGRLGALSRAHELVRPALGINQRDAQATTLEQLVAAILAPYRQPVANDGLVVEGPRVSLGSHTVTSLALVLHELATNAAKYGCLSSPQGRLEIRWTIAGDCIEFAWTEIGGPSIGEAPIFEGFGSQLARKSITGQLGGSLTQEWQREGLRVHVTLPLAGLSH